MQRVHDEHTAHEDEERDQRDDPIIKVKSLPDLCLRRNHVEMKAIDLQRNIDDAIRQRGFCQTDGRGIALISIAMPISDREENFSILRDGKTGQAACEKLR